MTDSTNIINASRSAKIINNMRGKIIAVIGDVMLDKYYWGSVSRISPEAPVPVIDIEKETAHLGGAANVAANLNSLGLKAYLCGVIGDDNHGRNFTELAKNMNIDVSAIYTDKDRPSTVKTRLMGNNQHIARVDREKRNPISVAGFDFIMNSIKSINDLDGIILEDYNKGVVTLSMIQGIIAYAKEKNIPVYVDPKFDNFFAYQGVTLFKPNKKEASMALGLEINTIEDVRQAGVKLLKELNAENILLTLGADGMILLEKNGEITKVPTIARNVSDVSGAGDTAIATLSAAFAAGATMKEAAALANYASGIVCEYPGIVSINPEELLSYIENIG